MRSSVYFNERTRARARTVRQHLGAVVDEGDNSNCQPSSNTVDAPRQEENGQAFDYTAIRKKICQHPKQPMNAAYRALQSLMPQRPSTSFTPETWWIVDRHYRPKLCHGATPLLSRCMRSFGWSEAYARRALGAYRQFLQLKTAMQDWEGKLLEPSKEVRHIWQQHILDVCNYAYDCILICGHVVGNKPDEEDLSAERKQRRLNTKQILENVFSEIDEEIWRDIISLKQTQKDEEKGEQDLVVLDHQKVACQQQEKKFREHGKATTAKRDTLEERRSSPSRRMTRNERRARSAREDTSFIESMEIRRELPQPNSQQRQQSPQRIRFHHSTKTPLSPPIPETKQSYQDGTHMSQPRPQTPVMEPQFPDQPKTPPFSQIFSSAFRSLGFDTQESRTDSPTRRNSEERCAFVEEHGAHQQYEVFEEEEGLRIDPIDARRQVYHHENLEYRAHSPLDSPFVSNIAHKRCYRSSNIAEDRKPVTVHIHDQVGVVTSSRVRRSTKLGRIFSAYATGKGVKPTHLHFFLNGQAVNSSDTPASLHLRDHDKIDCVIRTRDLM